jgi:hypothetical protein
MKMKAVKMTRRIRDTHYEQLKDKTWEEQVAFYKEQARALHKKLGSTSPQQSRQKEEAA